MEDKVIVTHRGALLAKYGRTGLTRIRAAIARLIAADRKHGIKTGLVYLDDPVAMKKLKASAAPEAKDHKAIKRAIDGVWKAVTPDYLLILGAPDVVPHQNLTNPAYLAGEDDDPTAWGDLPYACETDYGRDVARFIGPTRVVGRLPDLTGATEPSHLLALLRHATAAKPRPADDYADYFGLSAAVWQGSTRMSLENTFGNADGILLAPPKGPRHPAARLAALSHFINCHGAPAAPEFYGQKGQRFPKSLTSAVMRGAIRSGTVAAVECCYGGQLYDAVLLGLEIPICQSYLRQGCSGYLGSTTIAYGPADDNGAADLLCQYFLQSVLAGASLGRAALTARQQFVAHTAQMDPIDLKTLAQFNLLGDPSVQPVASAASALPKKVERATAARFQRRERRAKLAATGNFLQETKPTASRPERGARTSVKLRTTLANIARKSGLGASETFVAYGVKGGGMRRPSAAQAKLAGIPARYHVTIGRPQAAQPIETIAIVAKEVAGRIVDYRVYHRR